MLNYASRPSLSYVRSLDCPHWSGTISPNHNDNRKDGYRLLFSGHSSLCPVKSGYLTEVMPPTYDARPTKIDSVRRFPRYGGDEEDRTSGLALHPLTKGGFCVIATERSEWAGLSGASGWGLSFLSFNLGTYP